MAKKAYFLPYQLRWLADKSRSKIWEKSRRIGATYVASYEDVQDCNDGKIPSAWFSSADESAAREYIEYCLKWAKIYNVAAQSMGEQVLDEKAGIKNYEIRLKNGVKIHALSSNPKAFRSKGGKVTLDEFAWHEQPKAMWAAARPVVTWGYPIRILSTHNGVTSQFNTFVKSIKDGKLKWNLHTTDIFTAVREGLADKIVGRELSDQERADWIEQERESVADDVAWAEEYCCEPQDEKSAFLTYDEIYAIQRDGILKDLGECGNLYLGMDIGRTHDLSVLWVVEDIGGTYITRKIDVLRKTRFSAQREVLYELLSRRNMRRACIDATGIGMQLAEEAGEKFGASMVESVMFTAPSKERLATYLRSQAEDKAILIPNDAEIRADFHSVKKMISAGGNIRFDVASAEAKDSHADRFWAAALALDAAHTPAFGDLEVETRDRREAAEVDEEYLEYGFRTMLTRY